MQPAASLDQVGRLRTAPFSSAAGAALRLGRQGGHLAAAATPVVLAFLPLLLLHTGVLWARSYYQFFPFVVLGAVILAARGLRGAGSFRAGSRSVSLGLVAGSWALLAVAVLIYSPSLAVVAALATLLALAYDVGGVPLVRRLLPAWVFLWLIVPLPLKLDEKLVKSLQAVATGWSNSVLDLYRVFHYMEGNAVALAGRTLLIEESCSGIHSLMTCLTGTLFLVFWRRSGMLRLVALMMAAVGWVIVANIARIVTVAYMLDRWGIDLSEGWRHEALGFFMALVALALIASTDYAFQSFVDVVDWFKITLMAWRDTRLQRPAWDPLKPLSVDPGQGLTYIPWEDEDIAEPPAPEAPAANWTFPSLSTVCRTWLCSWPAAGAFGSLAVVQLALLQGAPPRENGSADRLDRAFSQWREASLPKQSGPFTLSGFERRTLEPGEHNGLRSLIWKYEWNGAQAMASVDYPFGHGWHELSECYYNRGWMTQRSTVTQATDGSGGAITVESLVNPQGRHGYLFYGFFDANGNALKAPYPLGIVSRLKARLTSWEDPRRLWGRQSPEKLDLPNPCCQVQLFVESELPLTPSDELQARTFFEEIRMLVRRQGPETQGGAQ